MWFYLGLGAMLNKVNTFSFGNAFDVKKFQMKVKMSLVKVYRISFEKKKPTFSAKLVFIFGYNFFHFGGTQPRISLENKMAN